MIKLIKRLKALHLPCATRARHGTAVCTHDDCGAIWQRDINGATNLLHLLLAQINKGNQTNDSRPDHLKFGRLLPLVDPNWRMNRKTYWKTSTEFRNGEHRETEQH